MRGQPITLNTLRDVNPAGLADGDVYVWNAATKTFLPSAGASLKWKHDRFTVASTPATDYLLSNVPYGMNFVTKTPTGVTTSLALAEDVDYTMNYTTGLLHLTSTPAAGDILVISYVTTTALVGGGAVSGGFTGVSFAQGQSGDFRIWTWSNGAATQQALNTTTGGGGTFKLTKSGTSYVGSRAGTNVVTWTDTGGIAQWGSVVGAVVGPLATSTVDNFAASGASFTDDFNRVNGPLGNDWTTSVTGANPGPQIVSNALPNTATAGADQAYSFFRNLSITPTSVQFDLSGAPNASGGFVHVACGVSGLFI